MRLLRSTNGSACSLPPGPMNRRPLPSPAAVIPIGSARPAVTCSSRSRSGPVGSSGRVEVVPSALAFGDADASGLAVAAVELTGALGDGPPQAATSSRMAMIPGRWAARFMMASLPCRDPARRGGADRVGFLSGPMTTTRSRPLRTQQSTPAAADEGTPAAGGAPFSEPDVGAIGTRRSIIIERIDPQLEGGRHAVKRVVGEDLLVTADIFADGHDLLDAALLLRA